MSLADAVGLTVGALLVAGLYTVMSFGLALIYGVMKIINLAHAGFMMFGAYTTYLLWARLGWNPLLTPLVVLPLFVLVGMAVHRVFVRRVPTSDVPTLPSLLLMFGLWLVLQNLGYSLFSADERSILTPYTMRAIHLGSVRISLLRSVVFGFAAVTLVALQLFLTRTWTGRAIRALTQNRQACQLAGIDVDRTAMAAFGLGTGFAALAGSLMANLYAFTPGFGDNFMLRAFVIIVLGGLENFYGVALGALVLALVEQWSVVVMKASLQPAIAYTLLVVALVVMPRGITGLLEARRRA